MAFVSPLWLGAAIGAIVASALVLLAAADAIHGRGDWIVLSWVLLFPLGYYYVSFPSDRPLITFDRIVLGGVTVALAFGAARLQMPVPRILKQVGIAWIIFLAGVLLSLRFAPNPLGKTKELLDVFVLPGILAWYLVRSFPLRRHLSTLHILTCLMAIYVAGIGFAEFATGTDLMPAPTGVFLVEETGLNRVNGPFTTNNSFGLIGLVTLLLLIFLHRSMAKRMPTWQTLLHFVGVAAALSTAVMPLFRSILLTLVLIGGLELVKTKRTSVRFAVIIAFVVGAVGLLWFKTLAPDMFGYRVSDPSERLRAYRSAETDARDVCGESTQWGGLGQLYRCGLRFFRCQLQGCLFCGFGTQYVGRSAGRDWGTGICAIHRGATLVAPILLALTQTRHP